VTPFDKAAQLYQRAGYDFDAHLVACARKGVVYSDKDCFLMAEDQGGLWFIWIAVGKHCLQRFCALAPYPLQSVAWAREMRGHLKPRVYNFSRVSRLCSQITPQ
jgi:hypothetical protein